MKPTQLGFGAMRLPKSVEECSRMFGAYLDGGGNYIDTAYIYKGSEEMLKKTLVAEHPRSSYLLADKIPPWQVETLKDCDKLLETQLKRCGVDYFDYYLLHSMNAAFEKKYDKMGVYEWAAALKKKGVFRHVGFSFHDSAECLDDILSKHPEMEFVQLQLNYMDNLRGPGDSLHKTALKYGKPIIVMEPVKGGSLASLSAEAERLFKAADSTVSTASWALRFAASLEGVMTVLSGMSTMAQVEDNLKTFNNFTKMSEKDYAVINEVLAVLAKEAVIPCTACNYCRENCPQGIEIAKCISIYNEFQRAGEKWNHESLYEGIPKDSRAGSCTGCGSCVEHCPQKIDIPEALKKVAKEFSNT